MMWEKVKLGDLCEVITKGTTPSNIGASFAEEGIKYIRSEMITSEKYISSEGFLYISNDTHELLKRSQLKKGDILFSMAGVYLGKTAILRECDVPSNTNQAVALIRTIPEKCNLEYVYYYLNLPDVVKSVNTISAQSAQPNINLTQIGNIPIMLPSRRIQDAIVSILSAYDDLIENNKKQIKLLEEAAQRLYKEWFVDLRFPGHENVPVVDGVPEGWEVGIVADIAPFKRGKTITKEKVGMGNIPVVAGGLEPAYYHNISNAKAPVITVSASGANAGYTRIYYTDIWASDCSFCDCETSDSWAFIYCFLKDSKKTIDSLQKGSAQPHVYAKDIKALELKIPQKELLEKFNSTVEAFFSKIGKLEKQNMVAEETRNRLLSKLMSGEIEV